MNWRRGLLRLWIVGSLCWVSLVGWSAYVSEHDRAVRNASYGRCMAREKQNPFDCFDKYKPSNLFDDLVPTTEWPIKHYALWAFSPPLALLTVGLAGTWIFAGFARDRRS